MAGKKETGENGQTRAWVGGGKGIQGLYAYSFEVSQKGKGHANVNKEIYYNAK